MRRVEGFVGKGMGCRFRPNGPTGDTPYEIELFRARCLKLQSAMYEQISAMVRVEVLGSERQSSLCCGRNLPEC